MTFNSQSMCVSSELKQLPNLIDLQRIAEVRQNVGIRCHFVISITIAGSQQDIEDQTVRKTKWLRLQLTPAVKRHVQRQSWPPSHHRHTTRPNIFWESARDHEGSYIDIFSPNRQCKQPRRQYPPQNTIPGRMVPLGAPYRRRYGTELHVLAAAFPPDENRKTSG